MRHATHPKIIESASRHHLQCRPPSKEFYKKIYKKRGDASSASSLRASLRHRSRLPLLEFYESITNKREGHFYVENAPCAFSPEERTQSEELPHHNLLWLSCLLAIASMILVLFADGRLLVAIIFTAKLTRCFFVQLYLLFEKKFVVERMFSWSSILDHLEIEDD